MDNLTNASGNTDYRPRSSQSPQPEGEGYPVEGCPAPTQSDEEWIEECKFEANKARDTLILMNGRPTRPIQSNPRWKKVLIEGELCYQYAELEETLFHSERHNNSARDLNTTWTERSSLWGTGQQNQASLKKSSDGGSFFEIICHRIEGFGPKLQRKRTCLKKLKDWKDYQALFQKAIDNCKPRSERARLAVKAIYRKDPEVVGNKGKVRGQDKTDWLKAIVREREWLAAEEKWLAWVKQQLPAVLSEYAESLMGQPTSRCQMEERSELEAKEVFNALVETGGRPTRPIRPVLDNPERDHTDGHLHVLCHWEGEYGQFEEELREWKKFLDYRQKNEADGGTGVQLDKEQSTTSSSYVDLWKDYRVYQQLEVEKAKQWVKFWQRQAQKWQEVVAEGGEKMREQVRPAELQLQWVEEQLSALLTEHASLMTQVSTSNRLEGQAKRPRSTTRLGQTTVKDLKSKRPDKSTRQSHQDKKKNRASADSTLDPMHPSRVSKAAGRRAPRRQRQSNTLADHSDGQNQGPSTTILQLSPANAALRGGRRLSTNEKKSGSLDASSAVDLNNSIHPPTIVLRRSNRLSKQNERMRALTADTSMDPAVLSQIASSRPLPRLKSKSHRAGKQSDLKPSDKPRGISKKQTSKPLRKRKKIHN
ncbi:MAG: hypothetical protein Q9195_006978 [Heterodermia aff. obscurata]